MSKFVHIQVISPNGITLFNDYYRLPVTIGRHSNATVSIPDAPSDMSRIHVTLKEEQNGIILKEESTLGTEYHGNKINHSSILLNRNDTFSIRNYIFKVQADVASEDTSSVAQVFLKNSQGQAILNSENQPIPPFTIGKYNLICLRNRDDKIKFESVPVGAVNGNLLGSYNLSDMEMILAIVQVSQSEIAMVASEKSYDYNVLINKHRPKIGKQITLNSLDVIEIQNVRLEVAGKMKKALRCSNPVCERLNAYDVAGNCSWCGHRLVLANTSVHET